MTIHSMTGFGSADVTSQGWTLRVDCRSVNHRNLDARINLPRQWGWLEPMALEEVKARLSRGRVEIRVEVEADLTSSRRPDLLDERKFEAVLDELRGLARRNELDPPALGDALEFREFFTNEETAAEVGDEEAFRPAFAEALTRLVEARAREGEVLGRTLHGLVDEIGERVGAIVEAVPEELEAYRTKLEERVGEALDQFDAGDLDEERLAREVVYYADRSDISEELQRAASHVDKIRSLLRREEGGARGKELDFYLQELIREANTMGSKSGSIAITDHVVAMKAAIEKMREQAANVE